MYNLLFPDAENILFSLNFALVYFGKPKKANDGIIQRNICA